jgi:hypothetical protein
MNTHRLFKTTLILLVTAYFQTGLHAAPTNDTPDLTIRKFLAATFSNDRKAFEETIVPNKDSGKMLSGEFVGEQKASKIQEMAQEAIMWPAELPTLRGKPLKPDAKTGFPAGARTIYQVEFRGTSLGINCVKQTNGWRIDLRWLLARMKKIDNDSPENSVKGFLYSQLTQQTNEIVKFSFPGKKLNRVVGLKPPAEEDWRQIKGLVSTMSLIEPEPDEVFLLPNGKAKKSNKSKKDELFLVGLLGAQEVTFELKKSNGEWKVIPYDYLTLLRKKKAMN